MSLQIEQRYFFEIAYDGSSFFGWQKQPDKRSVQQTIETVLTHLYSMREIAIVGCGRTDTGVHAHKYIFHVDLPHVENTQQLCYKMNKMLPVTIAVHRCWAVNKDMHARFSALKRTYRYLIHFEKNPFLTLHSTYLARPLDIPKMNVATQYLLGTHDFTTFSKINPDAHSSICTVSSARWHISSDSSSKTAFFEYVANRFLRNMVRATVGTLIEVGIGKITPEEFQDIFRSRDRNRCAASAPPQGLFLWDIQYEQQQ